MEKVYGEAFAEVLEVLEKSNQNIKSKIPEKFIAFLYQNKDENYIVKIDFAIDNWEDTLKQETLAVLALIYRDYIVTPEEREKLLAEEKEELIKIENELREKYNPENIFKNNNQQPNIKEEIVADNVAIVEYKESIFTKIKNWLKQIFKR